MRFQRDAINIVHVRAYADEAKLCRERLVGGYDFDIAPYGLVLSKNPAGSLVPLLF